VVFTHSQKLALPDSEGEGIKNLLKVGNYIAEDKAEQTRRLENFQQYRCENLKSCIA
jgi:hypothetical protein